MADLNEDASSPRASRWRFWSTSESVQNREPSVMAIAETVFAVIFYLWVALLIGALLPLYVAVAAAPLVLLRSDESVALGLRWFQLLESDAPWDAEWTASWWYRLSLVITSTLLALWLFAPSDQIGWSFEFLNFDLLMKLIVIIGGMTLGFIYLMMPMSVFLTSLLIRISATIVYLREGFISLPQNFRILILCTSPAQIPELVPGLNATGSHFRFFSMRDVFKGDDPVGAAEILFVFSTILLFAPAWLYRVTIKSTVWFWWPLAFLGQDLRLARNPELLQWRVMGSLWAKTSILVASASLLTIAGANLLLDGTLFKDNPLITPLGYLLLLDWTPRPWQICAVSASVLSIVLVYWTNDISGQFRIAKTSGDAELLKRAVIRFGWLERLSRLRLLFVLAFWLLVGTHALLYFNSTKCDLQLPDKAKEWAENIYGTHFPQCSSNPE